TLRDRSTLLLARSSSGSLDLDRVVREVCGVLGLPIELASGSVLGERFEVRDLVGRGGMGVVYRAFDRETGQEVALKLLGGRGLEGHHGERFLRESRLLASIDHARVARYVAHGTLASGQAFLAMQWLEGHDLAHALEGGPLSLADSLRVLKGACEAVAA